jgi:hypothetical protein
MSTSGTLGIGAVWDSVSTALAPVIRNITDIRTSLLGTPCQLLRIHLATEKDIDGQQEETYTSATISDAILKYPTGEVQLFDNSSDEVSDPTAFTLSEIMPIVLYTHFSGNNTVDIVNIEKNDIIVDVKFNERNTPMPIILKVNYPGYGQFLGQRLVSKRYELSVLRGPLIDSIQIIVNQYIQSLS